MKTRVEVFVAGRFARRMMASLLPAAAAALLLARPADALPRQAASCLECHEDPAKNAPAIHLAGFDASVHEGLDCTDCHAGTESFPHEPEAKRVDCASCHEDEGEVYRESEHGRAWATGVVEAASCTDCHGSGHAVLPSKDEAAPTHYSRIPETCGQCHAKPEIVAKYRPRRAGVVVSYESSVHGLALREKGKHAAVCTDCHGSHDIRVGTVATSKMFWQNIPTTCGTCHGDISRTFEASVHGAAAAAGRRDAPVCTDCHGEHTIAAVKAAASTVSPAHITETCGQCHGAARLATRYTMPAQVVGTYLQSFHGLAAQIGGVSAANCASCHGYHDILPSSDAASSIHPSNLPQTCGKCHQGIGTRLARGELRIHEQPGAAAGKPRIVNLVANAYVALIWIVIGGMAVFGALDFGAKLRTHLRRVRRDPGSELRLTPLLRAQHFAVMILFVVLAYTGFVHKYPDTFWSWPFRVIENGSYVRGQIHRIAGWAFTALFLLHLPLLVFTARGRAYLMELRLRLHDATDTWRVLRRNLGFGGAPPPHRRFNFAEKSEYWALVWGSVVMIVSGVLLIFTETALRLWPKVWIDLAQIVHLYEAVLATFAIVIWHLYWVIFDPSEYPMNTAWLIGKKAAHASARSADRDDAEEGGPDA